MRNRALVEGVSHVRCRLRQLTMIMFYRERLEIQSMQGLGIHEASGGWFLCVQKCLKVNVDP